MIHSPAVFPRGQRHQASLVLPTLPGRLPGASTETLRSGRAGLFWEVPREALGEAAEPAGARVLGAPCRQTVDVTPCVMRQRVCLQKRGDREGL